MLSLYTVFRAVSMFLSIIEWAIVIYCVLSWFQPRFRAFYLLRQFIQPFVSPFQKLSMKMSRYFNAPIDFTCLFAILGIQILQRLWWVLYRLLALRVF
ncbi:MAG: YggT family protein [Clostridia bacterium]|nr:YggT family protein [Clostridia bacterium]